MQQKTKQQKLNDIIRGMGKMELIAIINRCIAYIPKEIQAQIVEDYIKKKFPVMRDDKNLSVDEVQRIIYLEVGTQLFLYYKEIISMTHDCYVSLGGENSREILLHLMAAIPGILFQNIIAQPDKVTISRILKVAGFQKKTMYSTRTQKTESVWIPAPGCHHLTKYEHIRLFEETLKNAGYDTEKALE